jgi:hypothetical protein
MRIIDVNAVWGVAHKSAKSVSDFARVARNLTLDIRDSYRPEVHYMRGPGPKWRIKHQPRLGFEPEGLPRGEQHEVSPVYMRPRGSANLPR